LARRARTSHHADPETSLNSYLRAHIEAACLATHSCSHDSHCPSARAPAVRAN
jgi:hypothetical protein